jgi:SAM-dependent methyltransferase
MLPIVAYNFKSVFEGGLSLLPGFGGLFDTRTRGTDSARYCYSVWMRHLVKIHAYRPPPFSGLWVELGPGDSIGTGLAALLSGAGRYIAVDVAQHANSQQNVKVLEELISLFANREAIPDNMEFPEIKPRIDDFRFPGGILDADSMERNLAPKRLQAISDCLTATAGGDPLIQYIDPSAASIAIPPGSVDIIFSQAVLEHVANLPELYRTCRSWLKPHGLMSHQIDFRSHGTSREWNGHWLYPEGLWRLIQGNRPYLLNREPCSTHLCLLAKKEFQIILEDRSRLSSRLHRGQLAARFRKMPQEDLTTAGIYVLAEKRNEKKHIFIENPELSSCAALPE